MQSVKFYTASAVLFMLVVSITCESDTSTMPSSISATTTATSSKTNDASPANMVNKASEGPVLNDEPVVTPPATRVPDAAAPTTKPPILHNLSSAGDMSNVTTIKPNNTMANGTTETMANNAANTDKKDSKKNGASKGGPEFLVTSLIVLVLSALYA